MLPAFVANQLATGVEPPPPPPGPQPPWMASRPAGLRTIIKAIRAELPWARILCDPLHLVRGANTALDSIRREVSRA